MALTAIDDGPTDAQKRTNGAIDDALEHLASEWDREEYRGVSTCGFGRIKGLDGRKSLVRGLKLLARDDDYPQYTLSGRKNDRVTIEVAGWQLSLSPNHDSGYSLSVTGFPDHYGVGADVQRMDLQERVHELILERLQSYWGLAEDAYVYSRID